MSKRQDRLLPLRKRDWATWESRTVFGKRKAWRNTKLGRSQYLFLVGMMNMFGHDV